MKYRYYHDKVIPHLYRWDGKCAEALGYSGVWVDLGVLTVDHVECTDLRQSLKIYTRFPRTKSEVDIILNELDKEEFYKEVMND